jgi:predicted alpha/beta superfamily hydrolase
MFHRFSRSGFLRRFAILGCAFALLSAAPTFATAEPVTIPRSEQRLVTAASNGLAYRILISRPASQPPAGGWPVIYVLDGAQLFPLTAELVRILSVRPEATGIVPAIVVGVGHPPLEGLDAPRRALDYTPAGSNEPGTGGADTFLSFLVDELQPALARELPLDAARQTLIGHSYGGLFVLHAFLQRPQSFSRFVAFSPSIWFGDRLVLRGETELHARLASVGARRGLFVSIGEFEQTPDPTRPASPARLAKLQANRMVDNAREFVDRVAALQGAPVQTEFHLMTGENHGSIVAVSLPRALAFALAPAAP